MSSKTTKTNFWAKPATNKHNKSIVDILLVLVASMLLFVSITACLAAACSMQFDAIVVSVCSVVAVGISLLFALQDGKGNDLKLSLGLAIAVLVLSICAWVPISGGGAQVVNGFLYTLGTHTSMYQLPYTTGSHTDLVIFCAVASVLIAYLCVQLVLHANALACFLVALAMCILIVAGFVPPSPWLIVMALGLVAALCVSTIYKSHTIGKQAVLSGILVSGISSLLVIALAFVLVGTGTINTSGAKSFLLNIAYTIQYGGASYAMPMGQLNDLGALSTSDRPALEVQTGSSECREYLRGFTGENFDGTSWTGLDGEVVTNNQGLFYWLSQDGFFAPAQVSTAALASDYADDGVSLFTIANTGARGGYAYVPYSYLGQISGGVEGSDGGDVGKGAKSDEVSAETIEKAASNSVTTINSEEQSISSNTDMSSTISSASKNTVIASGSLLQKSYKLQDSLQSKQSLASQAADTYFKDESAYREFVYSSYLDIPDETKQTIEELFGESIELNSEQAKILVKKELDSQVEYDDTYATKNAGEDFVSYFLTQSKKGYSVHYASAAAMLMRYYGVPARYVEGYVLDSSNKNLNSTNSEGEDVYQLTENNAHAWVEYYLDGVGWIPFDVTPGFYDASFYEPTDKTQLQEDVVEWSVGNFDSDSSLNSQQDQQDSNNTVSVDLPDEFRFMLLWSILGLVIVLLIAAIARTIIKRRKLKEFIERLRTNDLQIAIKDGFSYGIFLGEKCLKIKFDSSVPYRAQGHTAQSANLCSQEIFVGAADANSKALFSKDAAQLTEEDRAHVVTFVDSCFEGLNANTSIWSKFINRIVRCIW